FVSLTACLHPRALPPSPTRRSSDLHVHIAKHWYSVPYMYIDREVEGRATATSVEIYCSGVRIATHPRGVEGNTTTDPNHMPKAQDRKSTRLNSSHVSISYAVFCLKY